MTQATTRVPPLAVEEFTKEQAELVGDWHHLNFSRTLVRHPRMYATFLPFLTELITRTTLPPRDREIVCLRLLRLCRDSYEYAHHVTIAQRSGMNDEEIEAAGDGQGAALTDFDRTLVRATEELYRDQCVGDASWDALAERYTVEQRMELVFLAGCYQTMAMLTKSFGMEVESSSEEHEQINALRTYV